VKRTAEHKESEDLQIMFIALEALDMKERLLLRRSLNDPGCHVVTISYKSEMGLFAWKTGCFHFISLPFSEDQLKLLRYKIETARQDFKNADKKMRLGYIGGYDFIPLREIDFIIGDGNYCKLYRRGYTGKTYTYRIKKFDDALKNEIQFVKITKSIIVNLNNVAKIAGNTVNFTGSKVSLELSDRSSKYLKNNLFWINI